MRPPSGLRAMLAIRLTPLHSVAPVVACRRGSTSGGGSSYCRTDLWTDTGWGIAEGGSKGRRQQLVRCRCRTARRCFGVLQFFSSTRVRLQASSPEGRESRQAKGCGAQRRASVSPSSSAKSSKSLALQGREREVTDETASGDRAVVDRPRSWPPACSSPY